MPYWAIGEDAIVERQAADACNDLLAVPNLGNSNINKILKEVGGRVGGRKGKVAT